MQKSCRNHTYACFLIENSSEFFKYKSVESLVLERCAGDYLPAGDSEVLSFSMLRTSNIGAFDRVGGSPLSHERAPTIHEI